MRRSGPLDLAKYDLASRSAKGHRTQIREALGFPPGDPRGRGTADRLARCRDLPARARADRVFCTQTVTRLGEVCGGRLLALVAEGEVRSSLTENEGGTALLASLKRDPGAVGLDSLLTEITKLTDVRKLSLPEGLFVSRPSSNARPALG